MSGLVEVHLVILRSMRMHAMATVPVKVYSGSCSEVETCAYASNDTTIHENSCNGNSACNRVSGTLIGSNSRSGFHACERLSHDTTIGSRSCNSSYACYQLSGSTLISNGRVLWSMILL
jgi:hypothetical protein